MHESTQDSEIKVLNDKDQNQIILQVDSLDQFQKEAKQILHDYQASIRTFRYLAGKAMRSEDPTNPATVRKVDAVNRHIQTLEDIRDRLLLKIFDND